MDPLATDERYQAFHEQVPSLAMIGNTPLVKINTLGEGHAGFQVFAKQEWRNPGGSLKDRPVKRMLLEAILDGRLTKDKTIIDSSSGNAGIAYAMIGRALGYKVKALRASQCQQRAQDAPGCAPSRSGVHRCHERL